MPQQTNEQSHGPPPPSAAVRVARASDGQAEYELSFYPGFASRCALTTHAGEIVFYQQNEPFVLPPGQTGPRAEHEIRLRGSSLEHELRLAINDPQHVVARITVELYAAEAPVGSSQLEDTPVNVLQITNRPMLCPPMCY